MSLRFKRSFVSSLVIQLSETGCWENSIDSEGLDFVLETDQLIQCIAYDVS
jgi:hypothetical protein